MSPWPDFFCPIICLRRSVMQCLAFPKVSLQDAHISSCPALLHKTLTTNKTLPGAQRGSTCPDAKIFASQCVWETDPSVCTPLHPSTEGESCLKLCKVCWSDSIDNSDFARYSYLGISSNRACFKNKECPTWCNESSMLWGRFWTQIQNYVWRESIIVPS